MRFVITVLLGLSAVAVSSGSPITFNFTGTVTQVPIDDFGTAIQPGDSIAGSFTFESTASDAVASASTGSYTSTGPAYGISASIGLLNFPIAGGLNIGVVNSFVDQYLVTGTDPGLTLELFFEDDIAAVFHDDSLPLTPPLLSDFQQLAFHLDQTDSNTGSETQVDGVVTALTCGADCAASAVPEPGSAALLFAGSVLLGVRRIRQSNSSRKP